MNGVSNFRGALPATTVLRIGPERPLRTNRESRGAETVMVAVNHPPRRAEVSALGALLPEVLARYGIEDARPVEAQFEAVA